MLKMFSMIQNQNQQQVQYQQDYSRNDFKELMQIILQQSQEQTKM